MTTATMPFHTTVERPQPGRTWEGGVTPERSHAQRMEALESANKIRTRRAKLKRDIKAKRENVFGHLIAPPEYIGTMKVWDLLISAPKVGRVKTNKIMVQCRISPSKTVGGLSERQRLELAAVARYW